MKHMKSKSKIPPSFDGAAVRKDGSSSAQIVQGVAGVLILLAIMNLTEGLGQHGALINLPLKNLMLHMYHWHADKIALCFALWTVPWTIKPLWGLISDKFPLLGYHRKSYLFLANALSVIGFGLMTVVTEPYAIFMAMMLTTIGMASASTLCGGVLVENGQRKGLCGVFVNQQWLWFSAASIVTSLLGGWLCDNAPLSELHPALWSVHTAALIVVFPPMAVMITCSFLLVEKRVKSEAKPPSASLKTCASRCRQWLRANVLPVFKSWATFGAALKSTWRRVRTSRLSLVVLFCFCYNFSPSFGTPLYTYQRETMHFSNRFIGHVASVGSIGCIVATLIGFWMLKKLSLRTLLYGCIILGTIAQGAYLWQAGLSLGWLTLHSHGMNNVLSFVNGVIGMWSIVVSMTLCARFCPKGLEGFTYAIMASVLNIASSLSEVTGSWMYVHWFENCLNPLILVSCAFTLIPLFLIPALKIGKDEAVTATN